MAFEFKPPIDPKNHLDKKDAPPDGWEYVSAREYAAALHGFPGQLFIECCEWEKRELTRIQNAMAPPDTPPS